MPDPKNTPAGSKPTSNVTYKNPRRTSPENSITLRHHRLAREASKRNSPAPIPGVPTTTVQSPRRNSSGESNNTGVSDPKRWFDRSNKHAAGNLDSTEMDIDPPFYQRETDSSNEDKYAVPSQSPAYRLVQSRAPALRPGMTHSSSADDYRSIVDDLTVENKRLRDELKKYRQMGPDSMRQDKLFEVKVHGLPSRKKRELEAALRDFTTSVEESSAGASPSRKKAKGKSKNISSKHASSSSGSNSRPADSAYASMSNGASSTSNPALANQGQAAKQQSDQKIESYLRDIPEGLWTRPSMMTEKDKKKLVVKRLEQLFTGKMGSSQQDLPDTLEPIAGYTPIETDEKAPDGSEATREATFRPPELRLMASYSLDISPESRTHSQSHSYDGQNDPRDHGDGSGSGSGSGGRSGKNASPQDNMPPLPDQRPTRPRDLDPDRKQVPSENMDYIRHLGIKAPESQKQYSREDVSPDAQGWVYLNLLGNLAQLHILNVTPDFIRNAVSEKSAKFQLSPDGRKIRWRGGVEGTRFSSDHSSGSNSQRHNSSDDTDEIDGSNEEAHRKKRKVQDPGNDVMAQNPSKFNLGIQHSNSAEKFHYKPLFVHRQPSSSEDQPSVADGTGSSYDLEHGEESNLELGINSRSRWGQSGLSRATSTGVALQHQQQQRKRRRDGAIIYYSGAPFCTDLSGDSGDVSPDGDVANTYDMTSSGDQYPVKDPVDLENPRPEFSRTTSGSSIPFRPLGGPALESYGAGPAVRLDEDDPPELTSGESDDGIDADFPWSDSIQHGQLVNLEASGLGGVYPDDHFVVVVSTRRPKDASVQDDADSSDDGSQPARPRSLIRASQETTDSRASQTTTDTIAGKLASMTTASPVSMHVFNARVPVVEIDYLTGKTRRLPPVPLPPPAFYFPSCDSDLSEDEDSYDSSESESLISRQAILQEGVANTELSGNDEEDEEDEDLEGYDASASISPQPKDTPDVDDFDITRLPGQKMPELSKMTSGSSAATAGGAVSGYNSSMEDA